MRRTRPGTLSISDCSVLEISARIDGKLPAPCEIVTQIEFGAQAPDAIMQRLEIVADVSKWPRLMSVRRLAARQNRSCKAMVTAMP